MIHGLMPDSYDAHVALVASSPLYSVEHDIKYNASQSVTMI